MDILKELKRELEELKYHNDDHILQSEIEDFIRELEKENK